MQQDNEAAVGTVSLVRLLLRTISDVLWALGISVLAGVIALYAGSGGSTTNVLVGLHSIGVPVETVLRARHEESLQLRRRALIMACQGVPDGDDELEQRLRRDPTLFDVDVDRLEPGRETGGNQWGGLTRVVRGEADYAIVVTCRAKRGAPRPSVPWNELGYDTVWGTEWWVAESVPLPPWIIPADEFRLIFLGTLQFGLGVVGLWRMWRNRKLPRGDSRQLSWRRALLVGLALGLGLGVVYWCYDQVLLQTTGTPGVTSSAWAQTPSIGWYFAGSEHRDWSQWDFRSDPPDWGSWLRLLAIIVIAIGYPLAHALFFLGGTFRGWLASGRGRIGAVLVAVLMAFCTLDWHYAPLIVLVGLALCELYRRSSALVPCILAHSVVATIVLGVVFGLIPGLPYPANRIVGTWQSIDEPESEPIVFHRGGGIQGGKRVNGLRVKNLPFVVVNVSGDRIEDRPLYYVWTGGTRMRIVFERTTRTGADVVEDLATEDYKVSIDEDEMALVRESDGTKFTYARIR